MCSPVSFPPPTDADVLTAAVADVAETSFFGFVDLYSGDAAAFSALIAAESGWLRATVRFDGPSLRGDVVLTLPSDLATQLAAAFVGLDTADLSALMIRDAAGELTNMICGLWLTRTHPHDRFVLAAPEVIDATAPDASALLPVLVNDRPVLFAATLGVRR